MDDNKHLFIHSFMNTLILILSVSNGKSALGARLCAMRGRLVLAHPVPAEAGRFLFFNNFLFVWDFGLYKYFFAN